MKPFLFSLLFLSALLFPAAASQQQRDIDDLHALIDTTQLLRETTIRESEEFNPRNDSELSRAYRRQQRLLRRLAHTEAIAPEIKTLQRYTRALYEVLPDLDEHTRFDAFSTLVKSMISLQSSLCGDACDESVELLRLRENLAQLQALTSHPDILAYEKDRYDDTIRHAMNGISDRLLEDAKKEREKRAAR